MNLVGFIDQLDAHIVSGWAADLDDLHRTIRLEVMRSDHVLAQVKADALRPDLKQAGYGDGRHAFSYEWPTGLRSSDLRDVWVRIEGSDQALIRNLARLEGSVERCDASMIRGWALNAAEPIEIREVDVYLGAEKIATLRAEVARPVDIEGGGADGHWFEYRWEEPPPQEALRHVSVRHANTELWLDYSPREEPPYYRLLQVPRCESPFLEEIIREDGIRPDLASALRELGRQGALTFRIRDPHFPALADRIVGDLASLYDGAPRLMDAWKHNDAVAQLAYLPEILELLERLYGRPPIPFQTLNFPVGTEQSVHTDTLHFNSRPPRFMCAVWVAFERVDADNGPLFYHRGSHRLPVLELDDVGLLGTAASYGQNYKLHTRVIQKLLDQGGYERETLELERGDAVIWAANLHHGGTPIRDRRRTRHSQVTHYYFEGVRYYSPMESNVYNNSLVAPDRRDIRTGEPIPNWARFIR